MIVSKEAGHAFAVYNYKRGYPFKNPKRQPGILSLSLAEMPDSFQIPNSTTELGIKPNGYIENGTDEDTGHNRKRFEGQSIHGDTVRAGYKI